MAVGIENYPNLDTTDPANYPAGNIKDNPGDATGTPMNVLTTADIHQFFYKLLDRAGITADGVPDNVGNGYQYINALFDENQSTPTVGTGWVLPGSLLPFARRVNVTLNRVKLKGIIVSNSTTPNAIFGHLATTFRPVEPVYFPATKFTASGSAFSTITIRVDTNGDIVIPNAGDIPTAVNDWVGLWTVDFYTD